MTSTFVSIKSNILSIADMADWYWSYIDTRSISGIKYENWYSMKAPEFPA